MPDCRRAAPSGEGSYTLVERPWGLCYLLRKASWQTLQVSAVGANAAFSASRLPVLMAEACLSVSRSACRCRCQMRPTAASPSWRRWRHCLERPWQTAPRRALVALRSPCLHAPRAVSSITSGARANPGTTRATVRWARCRSLPCWGSLLAQVTSGLVSDDETPRPGHSRAWCRTPRSAWPATTPISANHCCWRWCVCMWPPSFHERRQAKSR